VRQEYDPSRGNQVDRVSVEQVRSAMIDWLELVNLPPSARRQRFEQELQKQFYCQRGNRQAGASHTKTRIARLAALGIDIRRIKSCLPRSRDP
jgi:hypothetical protein